ncbi:hypothetical protein FHL15_010654 [Xylaria flabelliformis]|uniref:Diterpenoid pyrone biosynthesis cluster protein C n=1 Tax=Xylaria flabelliformis TaxID=2512241 RepID=A0A553HKJ2_9PEZI|nr:hypothetical protein FHL15_010654 [Xylaria flabelliformis]
MATRTSSRYTSQEEARVTSNGIQLNATKNTSNNSKPPNYFPHLPAYSDPTTGILSKLPHSCVPYAQLMRIDRPGGLYAFYFPYLIGLAYGACITSPAPDPLTLLSFTAILLPFNIVLRGAACTWNDTVDQDFDRRVIRCRHRPVARGAVSTSAAHLFTALQLALLYPVTKACFPAACMPHLIIMVLLFGVYALMKRVTYYPQVVLGVPFAWAVFFSVAALDIEPIPFTLLSFDGHLDLGREGDRVQIEGISKATLALFGANIMWTITYDTIYAHQDVADDAKAGVKGMALKFRHSTKLLAGVLSAVQVGLLVLCGLWTGFGTLYFLGTAGGVSLALAYYIYNVDLASPESCGQWFHDQFWIVGVPFISGFIGEYFIKWVQRECLRERYRADLSDFGPFEPSQGGWLGNAHLELCFETALETNPYDIHRRPNDWVDKKVSLGLEMQGSPDGSFATGGTVPKLGIEGHSEDNRHSIMAHERLEAEKGEFLLNYNPDLRIHLKSPHQNADPVAHPISISSKQHSQSPFFLLAWKGEIFSWLGSLAFFIAIVGILIYVKDKLLSDLQYLHITPNAIIGLLATFAQSLLLKPIDSAIGQVKWLRSLQKRPIDDFRVIDAASRGPWGSATSLVVLADAMNFWQPRTTLLTSSRWIGSSGAAVAIAALAMHTFFQEALHFDPVYTHTADASIPIARYVNGTGSAYVVGQGSTMGVDPESLSAPYRALFSPARTNFTVTAYCSTGNCTWDPYESLGICNTCQNITDKLKATKVDGMTRYQLPNGFGLQDPEPHSYSNGSVAFSNNASRLFSVLAVGAPNGTIPIQIGVNDNADDTVTISSAPPIALECLLQYCIRTMQASFVNGVLQETVLSNWTEQSQFPNGYYNEYDNDLTLRSPKTGAEFIVTFGALFGIKTWLSPTLVGDVYVNSASIEQNAPVFSTSISEFIYSAMNTSSTGFQDLMDNLANSFSLNFRTIKYQPPPVSGKASAPNSRAVVVWEWLILPIFELVATLLLLVAVILETKRKDMVPWGNSALAYIFHGLNKRPEGGSYRESQDDMEKSARELLVEFEPYDNGGHLVVAGHLGEES